MADDEEQPPQPAWEGPFDEDGLPHGKGIMKYPPAPVGEDEEEKPGDSYEGTFEHGKRHGQGKYTWGKTGATYAGSYENGVKSGKGIMTYPDKSVYEGTWVSDVIDGKGTYRYASGDIYQGEFQAGKRHGQGSYHNKAVGCQFVGRWHEGGFVAGHWILKDGSMFAGSFEKGVNPVEGAYFFSRSQLLQPGNFAASGEWVGAVDPFVGGVDKLKELAPAATAAPAASRAATPPAGTPPAAATPPRTPPSQTPEPAVADTAAIPETVPEPEPVIDPVPEPAAATA